MGSGGEAVGWRSSLCPSHLRARDAEPPSPCLICPPPNATFTSPNGLHKKKHDGRERGMLTGGQPETPRQRGVKGSMLEHTLTGPAPQPHTRLRLGMERVGMRGGGGKGSDGRPRPKNIRVPFRTVKYFLTLASRISNPCAFRSPPGVPCVQRWRPGASLGVFWETPLRGSNCHLESPLKTNITSPSIPCKKILTLMIIIK